jgi:hypothetical protein
VNSSKTWLKYQVGWLIPEQVLAPLVPGQPQLVSIPGLARLCRVTRRLAP